jgi:hypothetical protein
MLKKQEMVPGTVLKVKPVIKTGLSGFGLNVGSDVKDHLLITPECGGFLSASWKIPSGTILEVVEGPKRRGGINTAIVKVPGQEIVGHVYWCEMLASCEIVQV